jgi:lysophospholipase L1-like esterase
MIGDSRIYQWNIPGTVIHQKEYCNLGVNSQTSAQVLYRLILYFEQAKPEYVFIQVGINDLKAIGIFPEKKEAIIEQCTKNIELMINTCMAHKTIPVFCTIFPPGNISFIRRPFWSKEINKAVIRVNDSVINFCREKGAAIFDTYGALNDGKGTLIKSYQKDDLHLNEEGYKQLNKELAKFLTKEKIVNK